MQTLTTKWLRSVLITVTLMAAVSLYAEETDYIVGPGDVLKIQVTGEQQFSGLYRVRPDNTIFYSYLKTVDVGNMTTDQIAKMLTPILEKDYIANPVVSVSIKEYASKKIKILGAVAKPGSYTLKGSTKLLDIIAMAGDLTTRAGGTIVISRSKKKPSEKIKVAVLDPQAKVEGDKKTENSISSDVSDVDVSSVTEEQPQTENIVIKYSDITSGRSNISIYAGDVINVRQGEKVHVMGHVNRSGPITFEDKITLLEAISRAGGTSATASTKATYIIRKDDSGKSEKIKVRLDRVIDQKAEDIPLKANDVIVVPESFF